jgi:fermentation-respiration switch protein FrsA (DUF1100 family)
MLFYIVIITAATYLLLAGTLYFMQHRMVFYPTKEIFATPLNFEIPFEDIYLETADGVKINSWFIPADNAEYTVLFCHGNGGCLAHRVETIDLYHNLGVNFFILDYRGYGLSSGKPSENGLYLDTEAAWQFLVNAKRIPPDRIVLIGRSLGGAAAARLAAKKQPHRLICESSFVSIPATGSDRYPYFPVKLLCRYSFPTGDFLKQVKCPVLIIQSRDDQVVRFSHGRRLFALANEPKTFLELTGAHDECYFDCRDQYTAAVKRFICAPAE